MGAMQQIAGFRQQSATASLLNGIQFSKNRTSVNLTSCLILKFHGKWRSVQFSMHWYMLTGLVRMRLAN